MMQQATTRPLTTFIVVLTLGLAACFAGGVGAPLAAQTAETAEQDTTSTVSRDVAPAVYIDCNRCDMSHVRSELTFVNYVREPAHAQVHIIVADQSTGAGSRVYTFRFIGRGPFAGVENQLTYASPQTNTSAEERAGIVRTLKLGLIPYVARTPLVSQIQVSVRELPAAPAQVEDDPWQNWTFEIYGGGNFSNETTQSAWNARYGFYANRVTEDWKVRLRPYFNYNVRTIYRENADPIQVDLRRHGLESYLIKSLGSHWGAGIFAEYTTATLDNLNHGFTVAPAVEYSFFPYGEAATRQITLSYRVGYELADYIEETIYEKTEEALLHHSMEAAVRIRQPWGSVFSGLTGSSYLHDASFHRIALNGNVSFRLGHGISLNIGGNHQRINDQLALPRGDASLEDILLQRRRLATAYRSSGSIGLSYSFGSIFTNVVNPRL
jgi:hypothetical protein